MREILQVGRLDLREAMAAVDLPDHGEDPLAPGLLLGQEVTRPTGLVDIVRPSQLVDHDGRRWLHNVTARRRTAHATCPGRLHLRADVKALQ